MKSQLSERADREARAQHQERRASPRPAEAAAPEASPTSGRLPWLARRTARRRRGGLRRERGRQNQQRENNQWEAVRGHGDEQVITPSFPRRTSHE